MPRIISVLTIVILLISFRVKAQGRIVADSQIVVQKLARPLLPHNFYSRNLSFFCKRELEIQKLSSLNVFIRLGSKDYVDYMEKKPNNIFGYLRR